MPVSLVEASSWAPRGVDANGDQRGDPAGGNNETRSRAQVVVHSIDFGALPAPPIAQHKPVICPAGPADHDGGGAGGTTSKCVAAEASPVSATNHSNAATAFFHAGDDRDHTAEDSQEQDVAQPERERDNCKACPNQYQSHTARPTANTMREPTIASTPLSTTDRRRAGHRAHGRDAERAASADGDGYQTTAEPRRRCTCRRSADP